MEGTNFYRLGELCDSLQTALELTSREVIPVTRTAPREMRRFDRNAFEATLTEMYVKLGLEVVIPERFTPDVLNAIFVQILEAAATAPVTVQTYVVTEITGLSAMLNGAVTDDGGDALVAWGFKFGADSSLTDSIHVPFGDYQGFLDTSAADTGTFAISKTGLSPGNRYYYAAWGSNSEGMYTGDTMSFVTTPVTTIAVDNISASRARLSVSLDFGSAKPFTLLLSGMEGTGSTKWLAATNLFIESEWDAFVDADSTMNKVVAWLDSTQTYTVWAQGCIGDIEADCGWGYNFFSDTITFTTDPSVPDPGFTGCGDLNSINYQGHEYATVSIFDQCWLAENLRNENYNDGSPILGLTSDFPEWYWDVARKSYWNHEPTGLWSVYDLGNSDTTGYGLLYGEAAVLSGKLCPTGWHVPHKKEWKKLIEDYLDSDFNGDGIIAVQRLKVVSPDWDGTNESGFSAVASGYWNSNEWSEDYNTQTQFWVRGSEPRGVFLYSYDENDPDFEDAWDIDGGTDDGLAVRCLLGCPDLDYDGVCDADEPTGCTDSEAQNYDATAEFDDGSCSVLGCTDSSAVNFKLNANTDDGSCTFNASNACAGETSIDYSGHSYSIVSIADQCWFAENLRSNTFNDGVAIPVSLAPGLSEPTQSIIMMDSVTYFDEYGRLYNFAAVNSGKLCPSGWHVPSKSDWQELGSFLSPDSAWVELWWNYDRLTDAAVKLRENYTTGPVSNIPVWTGLNTVGFSAKPAGYRSSHPSIPLNYQRFGQMATFWTSDQFDAGSARTVQMFADQHHLDASKTDSSNEQSVRCLKD